MSVEFNIIIIEIGDGVNKLENRKLGMGWLPDYPDFRDYNIWNHIDYFRADYSLGRFEFQSVYDDFTSLTGSIDLRGFCPPIKNQGQIASSTANAVAVAIEYHDLRAWRNYKNVSRVSRLFLYKNARNLANLNGDSGASLRSTLESLLLFGAPPEDYWPYTDEVPDFDKEPSAFYYSLSHHNKYFNTYHYFSHYTPNLTTDAVLASVKTALVAGIPSVFGFRVFKSINQAATTGKIPFPSLSERILGGQAVVAVGYDDKMIIKNATCDIETQGALLISNSWGDKWGDRGYGFLPYEYVLKGIAKDFWAITIPLGGGIGGGFSPLPVVEIETPPGTLPGPSKKVKSRRNP